MESSCDDVSNAQGCREAYSKNNETTPLQTAKINDSGFRVIVGCFAVLTAIISLALAIHLLNGEKQVIEHGSVVSDNSECSNIGEEVLKNGGNAVDAAVAMSFCLSVVLPHLTGLGGGGLMLIYDHRLSKIVDYFNFQPGIVIAQTGVPGFLKGMYTAQTKLGLLKWKQILKPSIYLARTGFVVTESLTASQNYIDDKYEKSFLEKWLMGLKVGDMVTTEALANTLELIAQEGEKAFYSGSLAKNLTNFFPSEHLSKYSLQNDNYLEVNWSGFHLFTAGQGTGGEKLVEILQNLTFTSSSPTSLLLELKDQLQYEQGNLNSGVVINVMDRNDLYVSIVSGLGSVLGSKIFVPDGYILNNYAVHQLDGSSPSALPLIITEANTCGTRYVLGGIDYKDVVQLLIPLLISNIDLQSSVESPRARILNNSFYFEVSHAPSFSADEIETLALPGVSISTAPKPYPSINVIKKVGDTVSPYADSRGQGKAIVF